MNRAPPLRKNVWKDIGVSPHTKNRVNQGKCLAIIPDKQFFLP